MHELTGGQTSGGILVRSSLVLCSCIAIIALLLSPYAIGQTGSAGIVGVLAAAVICLISGLTSEGFAYISGRGASPLLGMLVGMGARMAPPLVICLVLAGQGADGRRHLAFICYLLVFYFATLAVETWLAVKRVSTRRNSDS
jgi:hypothetical protein